MRLVLTASFALVSACSQGTGVPSRDEMADALRAHYKSAAVVRVVPSGECQSAKVGERASQVCDFCLVWVDVSLGPQIIQSSTGNVVRYLDHFKAHRGMLQASFARAISYSQPNAEPTGPDGVWVVVGTEPAATASSKPVMASINDVQALTAGVHIVRQRGLFAETAVPMVGGSPVTPFAALDQFEKPEAASIIDGLVGACGP